MGEKKWFRILQWTKINMKTLTEAFKDYHEANDELARLRKEFLSKEEELKGKISENSHLIELSHSLIDIGKVQLAETIIYVTKYTGDGEQGGCIVDAIKQFSLGKPLEYKNLWKEFFGTKDYDRWSSQRSDHTYGYGPRHGSTNFKVAIRTSKKQSDLTPEEVEAVIYYLTNIKNIQAARTKV